MRAPVVRFPPATTPVASETAPLLDPESQRAPPVRDLCAASLCRRTRWSVSCSTPIVLLRPAVLLVGRNNSTSCDQCSSSSSFCSSTPHRANRGVGGCGMAAEEMLLLPLVPLMLPSAETVVVAAAGTSGLQHSVLPPVAGETEVLPATGSGRGEAVLATRRCRCSATSLRSFCIRH